MLEVELEKLVAALNCDCTALKRKRLCQISLGSKEEQLENL